MGPQFEIKIVNQHWIGLPREDLCSHGEINLKVNETVITQSGKGEVWGISESALSLLRTIEKEYLSDPINGEGLILHGCGLLLMVSCPISIHWTVKHIGNQVELSDFVKVETTNPETGSIYYPELIVTLNHDEYKDSILYFASQAKNFFEESETKIIADDYDNEMYQEFWDEFNRRLMEL
jgi:hypothetical protein